MITKVTITGADDSINPIDLVNLYKKYPFVEWGILLSRKSMGRSRFPSYQWMQALYEHKEGLNLSGHLCGSFVSEILAGDITPVNELGIVWDMFSRIQINTHGIKHAHSARMPVVLNMYSDKEFIFQFDNANLPILDFAWHCGVNCSALYDLSHGAGVLPSEWPKPLSNIKCGYAGGISPANIEEQIRLIEQAVGDVGTWIDMETHVRSNGGLQFDLQKVGKCLEISSKYILQPTN
jgi:hypothetical protein